MLILDAPEGYEHLWRKVISPVTAIGMLPQTMSLVSAAQDKQDSLIRGVNHGIEALSTTWCFSHCAATVAVVCCLS